MLTSRRLLVLVVVLLQAVCAYCQQGLVTCASTMDRGRRLELNTDVTNLTSTFNTFTSTVQPLTCHAWSLNPNTYMSSDYDCVGPDRWLLLEFYRMQLGGGAPVLDSMRYIDDQFFLAAKNDPPRMSTDAQGGSYPNPPLNNGVYFSVNGSDPGNTGTFMDAMADKYQRPHHRLLIPNITAPNPDGTYPVWWVTVANLARSGNGTPTTYGGYRIRATCVPASAIPCPRPNPANGPCNNSTATNTGTCIQADPQDPTSQVCRCAEGYGNYGCDLRVVRMNNGETQSLVQLPSAAWAYFTITVPPLPQGIMTSQTLLVELFRNAAQGGGDPLLLLKPNNTADGNVPFFADVVSRADLKSYYLQQAYHYIFRRDFATTGYSFYIGVLNNDARFQGRSATLSLKVQWGTPSQPFFCPAACNGRGTCVDPRLQPPPSYSTASSPVPQDASQGFICKCTPPYGGLTCEGQLQPVIVPSSQQQFNSMLPAGQWMYYVLQLDARLFSYNMDSLTVGWQVQDGGGAGPLSLVNAFMTLDENQYPRQADYSSPNPFRRGWQLFYTTFVLRSTTNQIQISGTELTKGSVLVLGLYNSDYLRSSFYTYQLDLAVPGTSTVWLHPYMSVVLGITSAVVLCLALTLCKRYLLARRSRGMASWVAANGGGTELVTVDGRRLLQIMPRSTGVPASVVATFPTYKYTPPDTPSPTAATSPPPSLPPTGSTAADGAPAGAVEGGGPTRLPRSQSDRLALQAAAAAAATTAATAAMAAAAAAAAATAAPPPRTSGTGPGATATAPTSPTDAARAAGTPRASAEVWQGGEGGGSSREPSQLVGKPRPSDLDAAAAAARAAAVAAHQSAMAREGGQGEGANSGVGPGTRLAGGGVGEDAPSCPVCLCEYEAGDAMRKLPCSHEFHMPCIDNWMSQHQTCPVCREVLVPQSVLDAQDAAANAAAAAIESQQLTVIYVPDETGLGGRVMVAPSRSAPPPSLPLLPLLPPLLQPTHHPAPDPPAGYDPLTLPLPPPPTNHWAGLCSSRCSHCRAQPCPGNCLP
ncbi:hypothetical protein V8C86DRAFT_1605236 [Haematococcus lacustris]